MRLCRIAAAALLFSAVATPARAVVLNNVLSVTGTDVPSNPEVAPGYSGYNVELHALGTNAIVNAIDVGLNPVDFPANPPASRTKYNFGVFGPLLQRWNVDEDGTDNPTPYQDSDLRDSHFTFTYDIFVMGPKEDNNSSYDGFTSPIASTTSQDWGIGSIMRAIVGTGKMNSANVPLAYLVIPDGQSVQFVGQVSVSNAKPVTLGEGPSSAADSTSLVSFSIGVPEPSCLLSFGVTAMLLCRRRRNFSC